MKTTKIKFQILIATLLIALASCTCSQKEVNKQVFTPHPNTNHVYQVHILKMVDKDRDFPFPLPEEASLDEQLKAKIITHYIQSPEEAKKLLLQLNALPVDLLIGTQKELHQIYLKLALPVVKSRRTYFVVYPNENLSLQNLLPIKFNAQEITSFEKKVCKKFSCPEKWYEKNKDIKNPGNKAKKITILEANTDSTKYSNTLSYSVEWKDLIFNLLNATQLTKIELGIRSGNIKVHYPEEFKTEFAPILLDFMGGPEQ